MPSVYDQFSLRGRSQAIRLLTPDETCTESRLVFRFRLVNLDHAPRFTALSYVWGDPGKSEFIILEGAKHYINKSLYQALKKVHLWSWRKRHNGTEAIPLWADQVCINQDDLDERGSQVALMADIYSGAELVYISLGHAANASEACEMVTHLAEYIGRQVLRYGAISSIPKLSTKDIESYKFLKWDALRDMMVCPWFSRAWVVQEIGLAKTATVMYGDHQFQWRSLMIVQEWLTMPAYRLYNLHHLSGWTAFTIWASFDIQSRQRPEVRAPLSFIDLLSHSAYRYKASNPRDYIFAFLGHPSAQFKRSGAKRESLLIRPNYRSTAQEVFLDFAKLWLNESREPYLLACTNHDDLPAPLNRSGHDARTQLTMPSWCPHWNYVPLGGTRILAEENNRELSIRACGPASFNFEILSDNRLMVHGFVFDTITVAAPTLSELTIPQGVIKENSGFGRANIEIMLKLCHIYREMMATQIHASTRELLPQDTILEFLSSTICRKYTDQDQILLGPFLGCLREAQISFEPNGDTLTQSMKTALDEIIASLHGLSYDDNIAETLLSAGRMLASRRLYSTSRGYIGIGPEILTEGDTCCIFSGSPVPFVLRPFTQQTFLLVGESFVHRIMRGEAVEGEDFEWTELVIE